MLPTVRPLEVDWTMRHNALPSIVLAWRIWLNAICPEARAGAMRPAFKSLRYGENDRFPTDPAQRSDWATGISTTRRSISSDVSALATSAHGLSPLTTATRSRPYGVKCISA
jgi:hypothetical protein